MISFLILALPIVFLVLIAVLIGRRTSWLVRESKLGRFLIALTLLIAFYLTPYALMRLTGTLYPYYEQGSHEIKSTTESVAFANVIFYGYAYVMWADAALCDKILEPPAAP